MAIDPQNGRREPFDDKSGYSGQDYDVGDEAMQGVRMPSGTVGTTNHPAAASPEKPSGRDLPPDAGRRAGFDPDTGEVHGSGAGAGGGNPGENIDPDEDGTS